MFGEECTLFSFNLFGYLFNITNVLVSSISYSIIVIFIIYFYNKKGIIYRLLNNCFEMISTLGKNNINTDKYDLILFFCFISISITNTMRCFLFPALNSFPIFPMFYAFIICLCGFFYGLKKRKFKFFWYLVPHEVPILLKPLLMLLESIILMVKPFILCLRLLLNIAIGHIVVHALYEVAHSFGNIQYFLTPIFLCLNLLEIGIGILQAYVFTIFASLFIANCTEDH